MSTSPAPTAASAPTGEKTLTIGRSSSEDLDAILAHAGATHWDVAKFLIPYVIAVAVALITLYCTVQVNGARSDAQLSDLRQQVGDVRTDVREIRAVLLSAKGGK